MILTVYLKKAKLYKNANYLKSNEITLKVKIKKDCPCQCIMILLMA